MKVAIVGSNNRDSMEFHFADAFTHHGDNVKIYDIYGSFPYTVTRMKPYFVALDKVRSTYSDNYDAKRFRKLSKKVNEFEPDLVVCFYREIHPTFVDSIKKNGRKVIHVNPDQMTTLGYQQVFASDYDAWFVKDRYMLDFMRNKMNVKALIYNEAFNHRFNPRPAMDKVLAEEKVGIDVMTYGTLYPYRTRMLKNLIDAGIDIRLFGTIPHRFFDTTVNRHCTGKYIVGEEKAMALYGSKIVFNNFHYGEVESVNCRFFEANGCGAFQLCDYKPLLKELLPVDPELVSYKTISEGIDKVRYYLSHPQERIDIASKIYEHFISHYTYDHLIEYILKNI